MLKIEREAAKRRANDLTRDITDLTKSYNTLKTDLLEKKGVAKESYQKFLLDMEKELEWAVVELNQKKQERDEMLIPVIQRELTLQKKELEFEERNTELATRIVGVESSEKDLEVKSKKMASQLMLLGKKEKQLEKKFKEFGNREEEWRRFRQGQEGLLQKDKEKLRKWLETERKKLQ